MCKLAAVSLDKNYNADFMIPFALLGELLIVQCDRVNNDGTGIGICDEKNSFVKHWSEASKFVFTKKVSEYVMEHGMGKSLIGHVRNATNGDKKDGHYKLVVLDDDLNLRYEDPLIIVDQLPYSVPRFFDPRVDHRYADNDLGQTRLWFGKEPVERAP